MGIGIQTTGQLGAAVSAARVGRDWTQAELAERAGVSRRWIVALEQGTTPGLDFSRVVRTLLTLGLQFELGERPQYRPPVDLDAETEW